MPPLVEPVTASSNAAGGLGSTAGAATATTTATGTSGNVYATATTSDTAGHLVTAGAGYASADVGGASTAQASVAYGGGAPSFSTSNQSVAVEMLAPTGASTSAVLAANSNINTAFGASPVFFALGELGGGHSATGTTGQSISSEIDFTADLTQLAVRHDLIVGLYGGTASGSGFSSATLDLYADGTDIVHQTFTTQSALVTYFTNHAIDLGSLASGGLSGATLSFKAVLTIPENTAGSTFDGGLIIGDPPPQEHAMVASHLALDGGAVAHSILVDNAAIHHLSSAQIADLGFEASHHFLSHAHGELA